MKRCCILLCVIGLLLALCGCNRIRIPATESATLYFRNALQGDLRKQAYSLSAAETARLRECLQNAKHNAGIGGCYYHEDISISFGDQVFAIAWDGCETLWDMNTDKYYEIEKKDWEYILSLFETRGIDTP